MQSIILSVLRWILTTAGIHTAGSQESDLVQLAGALTAAMSLAWGIWNAHRQAKQPPTSPGTPMGIKTALFPLLLTAGLAAGCASVEPGHDPAIVRAQQVYRISFETLNGFVSLERKHRDVLLQVSPEIQKAADKIRVTYPPIRKALRVALREYTAERSPENLRKLETQSDKAEGLTSEASGHIATINSAGLR